MELGLIGFAVGMLFLLIAKEAQSEVVPLRSGRPEGPEGARLLPIEQQRRALSERPLREEQTERLGRDKSLRVIAIGALLGCRDFAGVGGLSFAGIYLQKAHGFDAKHTGSILGTMMLLSVVVNPLLVRLTPGARRLTALCGALILGGIVAATVPLFPAILALPVLCAFQTCQAASYAISDAALLERVAPQQRGRVYGLYLTLAGTIGAAGPWIMGFWTDAMGERATVARGYVLPFCTLRFGMLVAALAAQFIARLGPVTQIVEPITETMPSTMEVAG